MSRYKPMGISALPERIALVDARANELGLSRSKYLQALIDADLDGCLLDCTKDAEGGKPIVKLRDGVNIEVLDKDSGNAQMKKAILAAFKTLGATYPKIWEDLVSGKIGKNAERAIKQK